MRLRITHVCGALLASCALAPGALAEESIFDPENADFEASSEVPESAEESILDPENLDSEVWDQTPGSFAGAEAPIVRAEFLGRWGTRLDLDTSLDGGGEDIIELSSFLDLGVSYEPSEHTRFVAQGQFRHWVGGKENPDLADLYINAADTRASFDARLGEAYGLWRSDRWTLTLGNVVTRWGSTDLVRPGDVINPQDQSTINALAAPERIPQLTLDATVSGQNWAIQGLVVPFFAPHRAWAFGRDTSLLTPRNPVVADELPIAGLLETVLDRSIQDDVQGLALGTQVPDETPKNASYGARGRVTYWNTDLGLGWYHGWDRTPAFTVQPELRALMKAVVEDGQVLQDLDLLGFFVRNREALDAANALGDAVAAGEELFATRYHRLDTILVDVARYLGPVGVRADVALHPAKTYMTQGFASVRRPTVTPALGLSYESFTDETDAFTITAEGFMEKPLSADAGLTRALVDEALRGSPDDEILLTGDGTFGAAAAILWAEPWLETQIQLGGLSNLTNGDIIATLAVSRRWASWMRTTVGLTLFEGPDPTEKLSVGGIYDHNDQLSFQLDGVF